MRLSQFRALSFDCYGTLIDWESGLTAALAPLRDASGASNEELLEAYGQAEHDAEVAHPAMRYSELLAIIFVNLSEKLGLEPNEEAATVFSNSIGDWPAFPDSAKTLAYLKRHFQLIILSNVDRASFARSNARLEVEFDQVLTAEEIGSYKPDLRNFEHLLDRTAAAGVAKGELLHVAQSLFHDHAPANRMGIASAWIDRRQGRPGGGATKVPEPLPHYDFRFSSLAEMADAHRAEIG